MGQEILDRGAFLPKRWRRECRDNETICRGKPGKALEENFYAERGNPNCPEKNRRFLIIRCGL